MLERVLEMNPSLSDPDRAPNQRLVGCCRDFTLFFIAIARQKEISVRSRVGFSAYFVLGLNLDHVIAEAWDEDKARWRLIDPELNGRVPDPLNLRHDEFIVAPEAWLACRRGGADPETFLVAPDFDGPGTRSWPYLVHDLAALNKRKMILWDDWGISMEWESISDDQMAMLDDVAAMMVSSDASLENIEHTYDREAFRVPAVVTSFTSAVESVTDPGRDAGRGSGSIRDHRQRPEVH